MKTYISPELIADLKKQILLSKLGDLKTFEQNMKIDLNQNFELRDTAKKEHALMFIFSLVSGMCLAMLVIVTAFNGKLIDDYVTSHPYLIPFFIFSLAFILAWVKFGKEFKRWVGVRIIKFKANTAMYRPLK